MAQLLARKGVAQKHAALFCMSSARIALALLALPGCSFAGSVLWLERAGQHRAVRRNDGNPESSGPRWRARSSPILALGVEGGRSSGEFGVFSRPLVGSRTRRSASRPCHSTGRRPRTCGSAQSNSKGPSRAPRLEVVGTVSQRDPTPVVRAGRPASGRATTEPSPSPIGCVRVGSPRHRPRAVDRRVSQTRRAYRGARRPAAGACARPGSGNMGVSGPGLIVAAALPRS